jgi:Amino acid transporters
VTISEENTTVLTERVGIVGVVALVVGNAVSIPIFVLPGPLAGSVGPGLIVAVVLAAAPAFLAVLYNAQLGSAMPVAGGLYVYITRLIAPFWGFLVPFSLPIVTWAALLFAAIGFAEYVRFFIDLPVAPLIYAFLIFVLLVNLLGIKAVARAQILFVVMLFLSIGLFIIPGIFAVDATNYTPVFPNGLGPLGLAFVALYYPYLGFGLLTDSGKR